jgi:hypothetical protein
MPEKDRLITLSNGKEQWVESNPSKIMNMINNEGGYCPCCDMYLRLADPRNDILKLPLRGSCPLCKHVFDIFSP